MEDWRTKPRNGKAAFLKHLPYIKERLDAGETQSFIRQSLIDSHGYSASAAQFGRYIKQFSLKPELDRRPTVVRETVKKEKVPDIGQAQTETRPSTERIDFKKLRDEKLKNTDWLALTLANKESNNQTDRNTDPQANE